MSPATGIKAHDVKRLLAERHRDDVIAFELSDGSNRSRLDAWAMPKSWAHWTTIGYEIKVSRADFLRDKKWQNYLEMCHEFNFVCPWGMIDPRELPDNVGLIQILKNGKGLRVKRKAPRRDIPFPEDVLIRVAMRATSFERHPHEDASDVDRREIRIAQMEKRIRNAADGRDLAQLLNGRIRKTLEEAGRRVDRAEGRMKQLQAFADILEQLGIDPQKVGRWQREKLVHKAIARAEGRPSRALVRDLEAVVDRLQAALPEIKGDLPDLDRF